MASSSIPAVIDALVARLQSYPGLSGVQVTDGEPINPEPEFLWIADASGEQRPAHATGTQSRDEEYDLDCIVYVQGPLDDQSKPVRDRAFAIMAQVEASLRGGDNASLGVIKSGWAQIGGNLLYQSRLSEEMRLAKLLFTVHVKARI